MTKRFAFHVAFTTLAFALGASEAAARYSQACFTLAEAKRMYQKKDTFSRASSDCLKDYYSTHLQFYKENGYSKYFGNRSKELNSVDKREKAIFLILAPRLLSSKDLRAFEAAYKKTGKLDKHGDPAVPGLSDLEKYVAQISPNLYQSFLSQKQALDIRARAQEEVGQESGQADLRGNLNPVEQNISCVDMSRRCLQEGFKAAGLLSAFEKIDRVVLDHDVSGTEMQKALADLGWRTLYFNPDPSQNAAWDEEDRAINPIPAPKPGQAPKTWMGSWGGHTETWSLYCDKNGNLRPGKRTGGVMCSDEYPLADGQPIPIDDKDLLVGFQKTVPSQFRAIPFFVGTAHSGYHVFPGYYGTVIEAHSSRSLADRDNLQVSDFNPIGHNGGPRWTRSEHYRSGVIVVPPGFLDRGSLLLRNAHVDDEGCLDLRPRTR